MRIRDLPVARRYPAANRCIYCGSTEPPLTLEHIIPYALEGDLEFPQASCERCRIATSRAEQICLRAMLLGPRTQLGVRTRNPRNRPATLRIGEFDRSEDGSAPADMQAANFRWNDLPLAEHPTAVILPCMPEPGIFSGRTDAGDFPYVSLDTYPFQLPHPGPEGREQAVLVPFRPDAFAKMPWGRSHGRVSRTPAVLRFPALRVGDQDAAHR
jgi:5-methylcytosine-specific restriction endonuclease McrA